eukprot:403344567
MSGWEAYIYQLQNVFDATTGQYKMTNVNEHAGIFGLDGTPWAVSAGFNLGNYEFNLTLEDDSKKKVNVNEFVTALEATKGNRKGSEAGIRMNNQKYMLVKHNAENNSAYLGREGGGGACVARTKQCVVIGVWNKAGVMSNGQLQNAGDCNDLTEKMAQYLTASGY